MKRQLEELQGFHPELFEPRHEGLHPGRLDRYPERVYAEQWRAANDRRPGVNHGFTALEWILTPEGQRWPQAVSQASATVAACVVQWLGTNCGRGFLLDAERRIAAEQQLMDEVRRESYRPTPTEEQEILARGLQHEVRASYLTEGHRLDIIRATVRMAFEAGRRDAYGRGVVRAGATRGLILRDEEE